MVRDLARARDVEVPSDADLATRAAAGDVAAFDELYRRHAESAWRVAQAVAANAEDAADAVADAFVQIFQALPAGRLTHGVPFRPYLLKATRNAAIDSLRRGRRLETTGELDALDGTSTTDTPHEHLVVAEELSLVAEAFRQLPERWRSVLWLTEVEAMPARDAAVVLGKSPNAVAQLAMRARAGLRRHYLQAHVRNGVSPECRPTVDQLGAYVGGALSRRDVVKVERHLEACAECRSRLADLEDLGSTLRRGIVIVPLGVGAALGRATKAAALASETRRTVASTTRSTVSSVARRALTAAVTGVLAAGVAGVVLHGGTGPGAAVQRTVRAPIAAPASPQSIELSGATRVEGDGVVTPHPAPPATPAGTVVETPSAPEPVTTPTPIGPTGSHPTPPPPPDTSRPPFEVTASGVLGATGLGVAAGGCNGLTLEPSAAGCVSDPRSTVGVTLDVSAAPLPRLRVPLP